MSDVWPSSVTILRNSQSNTHDLSLCFSFRSSTPNYYVPEHLANKLEKAKEAIADLEEPMDGTANNHRENVIEMNIIPMKAGHEVEIHQPKIRDGKRFYMRPFRVNHCGMASLGYSIICKTSKTSLKEEYQGINGKALGNLVKRGIAIKETKIEETVEVCYTGDTCIDGLLLSPTKLSLASPEEYQNLEVTRNNDDDKRYQDHVGQWRSVQYLKDAFTARLIFCEMTFLNPTESDLARERGHLCVIDILPILQSHGWNCASDNEDSSSLQLSRRDGYEKLSERRIVFYHISGRYGPSRSIIQNLRDALPSTILGNVEVAISPFLSDTDDDLLLKRVNPAGCISLFYDQV